MERCTDTNLKFNLKKINIDNQIILRMISFTSFYLFTFAEGDEVIVLPCRSVWIDETVWTEGLRVTPVLRIHHHAVQVHYHHRLSGNFAPLDTGVKKRQVDRVDRVVTP